MTPKDHLSFRYRVLWLGLSLGIVLTSLLTPMAFADERAPLDAARQIIVAVNGKDAAKYAAVFADDAAIRRHGETAPLLTGRQAIEDNRRRHFERFPEIHAEIQHLVQIGAKVVMHDRVWLNGKDGESADIVEILEFEGNLVTAMEIIQVPNIAPQNPTPKN